MSSITMGYVRGASPFTGCTYLVHLIIGDLVSEAHDLELWCTQGWLAKEAHVSDRGVRRALDELVEAGWLNLIENNALAGKPNKYRFAFPVDYPLLGIMGGDIVSRVPGRPVQKAGQGVLQNPKNSNEQNREDSDKKSTGYFAPGTGWINEYDPDKDTS